MVWSADIERLAVLSVGEGFVAFLRIDVPQHDRGLPIIAVGLEAEVPGESNCTLHQFSGMRGVYLVEAILSTDAFDVCVVCVFRSV